MATTVTVTVPAKGAADGLLGVMKVLDHVPRGATVNMVSAGRWNIYGDPSRLCGAGGSGVAANNPSGHGGNHVWPKTGGAAEGCLVIYWQSPTEPHKQLWFDIGYFQSDTVGFIMPSDGPLALGPNDDYFDDNSGSLTVTITVT